MNNFSECVICFVCLEWFPALRSLSDAKDEESKAAVLEQIVQGMAWLEDVLVKCNNGKGFLRQYRVA